MSLPDAEARGRIAEDLEHSLVVVAGAGTGKTASLVGRVVNLVAGGAALRELAVITFTEAAAAELRLRLAEELSVAARRQPDNAALSAAVEEVDEAAVCTLHAFAQRILVEHALAAGLPPGFDVLDELSDRVELEAHLAAFTDRLLDDPEAEGMLLRGFMLGLGEDAIVELAWCLHRHWDRLEDGAMEHIWAARPGPEDWPVLDLATLLEALGRALSLEAWCTAPDDLLLSHLREVLVPSREMLAAAAGDEQAALALLVRLPNFGCTRGQKGNWGDRAAEVRQACGDAEAARQALLDGVRRPVLAELLARLARFTLDAAGQRATEGRITFHDLLVHARRLLRNDPVARGALGARYRRLLVDEFQDTDPLQVELAAWLASAVEGSGDLGDARPGALFVVGDPKQSIYRFRRADIELFERVTAAVGEEVVLSANFRSVPGIVRFVNAVFPALFGDDPEPGQATYHALVAERRGLPARPGTSAVQLSLAGIGADEPDPVDLAPPPVAVVGGPVEGTIGDVRRAAAAELALALRRVVAEQWPVSDPDDPTRPPRPARFSDVAVLIPARTALGVLEEAFEDAQVPYRLEGAALLWGSEEVGDVLAALGAADEPSDAISVLAALRAPGLGCGDDDLVDWRGAGGLWDPRAETPPDCERHPVARAMAALLDLHQRKWWAEPSELVASATEALSGYALAFAQRRPRQVWQRLSWLADQARLFDETVGGSLHDFLRWAELQRQGDGRSASIGPPEADDDSVRVMTVHGAKGLEFPVVVLSGLERDDHAGYRSEPVLWRADGTAEVGLGLQLRSDGHDEAAAADRELDRLERVRLLYVAMTRARDHLVLSLHHRVRNGTPDTSQAAALEDLCRSQPLLWRRLPEPVFDGHAAPASANGTNGRRHGAAEDPGAARRWAATLDDWALHRSGVLGGRRARQVVTASALAQVEDADAAVGEAGRAGPGPTDGEAGWVALEAQPRRGDVGLGIGRSVHGALAIIDFSSGRDSFGADAAEVARRQAERHGVAEHAGEVEDMVRAALASPVLEQAAGRRHHKELYLAMPLGAPAGGPGGGEDGAGDGSGGVFEGFADLVVEDGEGLMVVDYKTDRVADEALQADMVARYRRQLAAYAAALHAATGRPVVGGVLLFVGAKPPRQHVFDAEELAESAPLAGLGLR